MTDLVTAKHLLKRRKKTYNKGFAYVLLTCKHDDFVPLININKKMKISVTKVARPLSLKTLCTNKSETPYIY